MLPVIIFAGYEKKLRNAVYRLMQTQPRPPHPLQPPDHAKEAISYIRKAQVCIKFEVVPFYIMKKT